jgi:hypothetical protein
LNEGDVVYPTTWKLKKNAECYFDGKGPRTPGWRTDHTWVMVISQIDEDGECPIGWVNNDRMSELKNEVENNFELGDVLYGRWEARVPWRGATGLKGDAIGGEIGSQIGTYKHNIIDDINNAIIYGNVTDKDVDQFAQFLEDSQGKLAKEVRIRKMCKCGLTYVTSVQKRKVHFILDGLDAQRVVDEAGVWTEQGVQGQKVHQTVEKFCTGAEMRTLMRQAMHNKGLNYGRNCGIDLNNVWFYLRTELVPAPWEKGAPGQWKDAWEKYKVYRISKPSNNSI